MNLLGQWRIIEMDLWDREAIELLGPGYIEFRKDGTGSFRFIAVEGCMDCRAVQTDNGPAVEFSWSGSDELALSTAQIRLAIDFYGVNPAEVDDRIAADDLAAEQLRERIDRRERLLSS